MAKKPKLMRAYRLRLETITEIERLADEWECTHAEVIERALAARRSTIKTGDPWEAVAANPKTAQHPSKSPLLKPSKRGKK